MIGFSVMFLQGQLIRESHSFLFWRPVFWNPVDLCFSLDRSLSKPACLLVSHPGIPLRFSLMFDLVSPGSNDASVLDICPHFVGAIKKWIRQKFLKPCISGEKKSLYFTCSLYFDNSARHRIPSWKSFSLWNLKALFSLSFSFQCFNWKVQYHCDIASFCSLCGRFFSFCLVSRTHSYCF